MAEVFHSAAEYVARDPDPEKVPLYTGCLMEYGVATLEREDAINLLREQRCPSALPAARRSAGDWIPDAHQSDPA